MRPVRICIYGGTDLQVTPTDFISALAYKIHQLRWRDHYDSAAARSSEDRRGAAGDPARSAEVSGPCSRDGQQSLAHAVRRVHRHHRQHGRLHEDREDRYDEEDAHGAGRPAAGRRRRGAAQEEPAVHAEHRDRQHHARFGGVLPDEGQLSMASSSDRSTRT